MLLNAYSYHIFFQTPSFFLFSPDHLTELKPSPSSSGAPMERNRKRDSIVGSSSLLRMTFPLWRGISLSLMSNGELFLPKTPAGRKKGLRERVFTLNPKSPSSSKYCQRFDVIFGARPSLSRANPHCIPSFSHK